MQKKMPLAPDNVKSGALYAFLQMESMFEGANGI
ncbi:MAG: hypothetical protein BWY75_01360 [bacterium ADurb.Bin425]|nr:MAG: hypothetical protein BWY75_01360 [bacterium ADurb.Bin425]